MARNGAFIDALDFIMEQLEAYRVALAHKDQWGKKIEEGRSKCSPSHIKPTSLSIFTEPTLAALEAFEEDDTFDCGPIWDKEEEDEYKVKEPNLLLAPSYLAPQFINEDLLAALN